MEDGCKDGNMILSHYQLLKLTLALWSLVYTISSILLTTSLGLSRSNSILATLELSQSLWKHLVVPWSQQDSMKFPQVCMSRHSAKLCLFTQVFPWHSEYVNFCKSYHPSDFTKEAEYSFLANHPESSEILFCVFPTCFMQSWIHSKAEWEGEAWHLLSVTQHYLAYSLILISISLLSDIINSGFLFCF